MDESVPQPTNQPPQPAPPMGLPAEPIMASSNGSRLKKIVIGVIVLGFIGVGATLWWMITRNNQTLDVAIIAPDHIQSGVPFEIAVTMSNNSGSDLKDAQVSLSLPEGVIFVGTPGSRTVELRSVGSLAANKLSKESFMVMATGIENSIVQVRASVSYIPGALSSRFEQIATHDLVIGEAGIEFNIAPPTKAFGGEEFSTEITYRNLSAANFANVQLKLTYPTGFTFNAATKAPTDSAHTTWDLGPLTAGDEGTFTIKGFIIGQDNENFEMRGLLTAAIGEGTYDIATQAATIIMQPSPLSIQVGVAPSNSAIFGTSEPLQYRLTYTNNTPIGLRDVIVQAKLVGEMFDLKTLKTNGSLRASDNTIVWNASRVPQFASLAPGATGFVEFSLQTKSAFPITRLSSKDYTLTVQAEIESPTVPNNVSAQKTIGVSSLTSKMRGALNVTTLGYYRDAASGITNSGIFPPHVGQPTRFTLHWVLRNTSTDLDAVHLRAFLGPNVRYTGVQKTSVASSTLQYNDRTQEVTWDIPHIQATRGVLGDPLEMIFQVELTPATNQVQTTPMLIQETTATYTDAFTGEQRSVTAKEVSTRLPDDPTITGSDRSVKE